MSETKGESETLMCSQCPEKPAIGQVAGHPLCVECYTKLQNAHAAQQSAQLQHLRHLMAMMNYSEDLMWSMVGLGPRRQVQIPPMPATAPMTFNNIKLDRSVVGAINTGNVRDIDVNLNQLHEAGLEKLKDAIAALTEAVAVDQKASAGEKNALLEQIAFLSSQATAAASDRKPGMIKAAMMAISAAAGTITSITKVWEVCEPLFKKIFGYE